MKKALLAAIVVALLALAAWMLLSRQPLTPPINQQGAAPEIQTPDNSAQIKADLESLQINDLDQEFKGVDADLNQL